MKFKHYVIAAGLIVLSSPALADETLVINGRVSDSTCKVALESGSNFTVTMNTVNASAFNGINTTVDSADVVFILTDCTTTAISQLRVNFIDGVSVSDAGNLKNTLEGAGGAASGVDIRLYNPTGNPIDIKNDTGNPLLTASAVYRTGTRSYRLPYGAKYIQNSTSRPTGGDVKAIVGFEMQYL